MQAAEAGRERDVTNAYLTAAWSRAAKLPSLGSILNSIKRHKHQDRTDIAKAAADHEALLKQLGEA